MVLLLGFDFGFGKGFRVGCVVRWWRLLGVDGNWRAELGIGMGERRVCDGLSLASSQHLLCYFI